MSPHPPRRGYTPAGGSSSGDAPAAHASTHADGGSDEVALDASQVTTGTFAIGRIPTGTSSSTVALGNDSRITGAVQGSRLISAGTGLTGGGDLTADRTLTVAYGTTSGTAAQGNDSRLSDARTPTAHATSHQIGGSDEFIITSTHTISSRIDSIARTDAQASITLTSQTMLLGYFTPEVAFTATNLLVCASTTQSATITLGRMGLYSVDGSGNLTLLQGTTNDTALLGTGSTVYTKAITSTALTRGSRYAVGLLMVGTTAGSVRGASGVAALTSLSPRTAAAVTGQSDLPSSVAVGSLTTSGNTPWFGLT